MAKYTWRKSPTNTRWDNPARWDPTGVPKEGDDVTIPGKYTDIAGPEMPTQDLRLARFEILESSGIIGGPARRMAHRGLAMHPPDRAVLRTRCSTAQDRRAATQ